METMVIDRETRPETILSFVGAGARAEILKLGANMIMVTPFNADGVPDAEDDEISAIFDGLLVDMTGDKFDRDVANDYD